MSTPFRGLVPYVFVQNVQASIDFYAKLGFHVARTFAPGESADASWAWLQGGDGALMIERASHPIRASQQAFMLVLYVEDVAAEQRADDQLDNGGRHR